MQETAHREEGDHDPRRKEVQLDQPWQPHDLYYRRMQGHEGNDPRNGGREVPLGAPPVQQGDQAARRHLDDEHAFQGPVHGGGDTANACHRDAADHEDGETRERQEAEHEPAHLHAPQPRRCSAQQAPEAREQQREQVGNQHDQDAVVPRGGSAVEGLPLQELGGEAAPRRRVPREPVQADPQGQRDREVGEYDEENRVEHCHPLPSAVSSVLSTGRYWLPGSAGDASMSSAMRRTVGSRASPTSSARREASSQEPTNRSMTEM